MTKKRIYKKNRSSAENHDGGSWPRRNIGQKRQFEDGIDGISLTCDRLEPVRLVSSSLNFDWKVLQLKLSDSAPDGFDAACALRMLTESA